MNTNTENGDTTEIETEQEEVVEPKVQLETCFLAADGKGISDLDVCIKVDGVEYNQKTDEQGFLPNMVASVGLPMEIALKRPDGTLKTIDQTQTPDTDTVWTYVSPKTEIQTQTELHQGQPGNAEQQIPKKDETDAGQLEPPKDEQNITNAKVANVARAAPKQIANDPIPTASPKVGRNKKGNPLAVLAEKYTDWWGSWRLPTFNLWGQGAQAASLPLTPVAYKGAMAKQVETLLAFAAEQTEYRYTEGTAGVLASMTRGEFKHVSGEKRSIESIGLCYTYVKVALTRTKIIDGILASDMAYEVQDQARLAGAALVKKGFTDVTNQVPDARWAAAGDVIVYAWTPETWEKRKTKKNNPKLPNYGHIDIRSITGYVSDFIPNKDSVGFGGPSWAEYENIRIYRKVFDLLPTLRIKAFLRCIRDYECQAEPDDNKRYNMLNTALPYSPSSKRFGDYKKHPWATVPPQARLKSTAAGAYQIVHDTWLEIFTKGLIALPQGSELFSPAIQDRIAVMKLEDRWVLHLIRKGEIEKAVSTKTKAGHLYNEWTSLPGGKENPMRRTAQGGLMDMAYLLNIFDMYLTEEKRKAGLQ